MGDGEEIGGILREARASLRHLLAPALLYLAGLCHAAGLPVVATTPDLLSLVQAVGGEDVDAISLVPPGGNAEEYAPRTQDLLRLQRARLVVRVGLDFDLWLDPLLKRTGIAAIQRGGEGHADASDMIALLDVRGGGLAASGHAHGAGNPHYWLDPLNAEIITGTLAGALARLDPAHAPAYERRRNAFLLRLRERVEIWTRQLGPLQGRPLLAHHNSWSYFARRFRLNIVATIEPRPGIAPSPAHLARLVERMRTERISLILRQPHESARQADLLARASGARVVVLGASVGTLPAAADYFSLFEANVSALRTAWDAAAK